MLCTYCESVNHLEMYLFFSFLYSRNNDSADDDHHKQRREVVAAAHLLRQGYRHLPRHVFRVRVRRLARVRSRQLHVLGCARKAESQTDEGTFVQAEEQ